MAGPRSLARGEGYHANGMVGSLVEDRGTISAKVRGTHTYRVTLGIAGGKLNLGRAGAGDPDRDLDQIMEMVRNRGGVVQPRRGVDRRPREHHFQGERAAWGPGPCSWRSAP